MPRSRSKKKGSPRAAPKRKAAAPTNVQPETLIAEALAIGTERADKVFKVRQATRVKRAKLVREHALESAAKTTVPATPPAHGAASPLATSRGVLVAEGDSWFDYPLFDVLKQLDDQGYDIESVAQRGDAIEEMAYGDGQLDDFSRRLEKLFRSNIKPKALLLSGGGNDVAGPIFAMLINHRRSPTHGLNLTVLEGVVERRIKLAYVAIVGAVTRLCVHYLGVPVPILVHGYDYPVPDGRGYLGGWGPLPGPWLEPGFRQKGYPDHDLPARVAITIQLIDRLNVMLGEVAALPDFAHVHYVDLRNTLSHDLSNYETSWDNELHPTRRGFKAVTAKFADVIARL